MKVTKEEIKDYREKLANISDEDFEKIANIIMPIIEPDHYQPIIDAYKEFALYAGYASEGEFQFCTKVYEHTSSSKNFYRGWKSCEKYYNIGENK